MTRIDAQAMDKPPIGEPCNGCGLCCRITVCGAGSYAMGLVDGWGQRAPGPCPALVREGAGWACGVVRRPKDWIKGGGGVMPLREAMMVMIGAGAGCDEAGDEPDESALPKMEAVARGYVERCGEAALYRAAAIIKGCRR